jgi:creatinine amidohydrolase
MRTMRDNARAFDEASAPPRDAVLAVGAVEQHGAHLPVGTDCFIAEHVAARLAEKLDAYLLPPLSITSSIEHRLTRGTVYLKAPTLAAVVRDIAESLRFSGFRRLVLVNGHGGNWILKPTIRQINRDFPDFRAVLLHTDIGLSQAAGVLEHLQGDVHAGEFETSVMLHIHPELVGPIEPARETTFPPQHFMDYFDTAELTSTGYWGFPEKATAEKGRKMLDLTLQCALEHLEAIERHAAPGAEQG